MPDFFKTVDPLLYSVDLYYDKDYYKKYSNFYKLLCYGIDTLQDFINYSKSKVTSDVIGNRTDLYKYLDSTGIAKYQQIQYKIYWYEKFFSDLQVIQDQFSKAVESPNYFRQISDSIGLLRNTWTVIDDSTQLIKDNDFSAQLASSLPLPTSVGSSVYSKLRPNTLHVTVQLGFLNTVLFRHNMSNLQDNFTYPNQAHGENLVTDFNHYNKIVNISKEVMEPSLRKYYGDLYNLILFYENYNPTDADCNLQVMPKGAIEVTIEDVVKKISYIQEEVTPFVNSINLYQRLVAQAVQ